MKNSSIRFKMRWILWRHFDGLMPPQQRVDDVAKKERNHRTCHAQHIVRHTKVGRWRKNHRRVQHIRPVLDMHRRPVSIRATSVSSAPPTPPPLFF